MSEEQGEKRADEETVPDTSLHAYREGREEDVEGDVEKLKSGDPDALQQDEVAGGEDSAPAPDPPDKA